MICLVLIGIVLLFSAVLISKTFATPYARTLLVSWPTAAIFGLGVTGLGLLYGAISLWPEAQRQWAIREQHPGQPWDWSPDWKAGRIESNLLEDTHNIQVAWMGGIVLSFILGLLWHTIWHDQKILQLIFIFVTGSGVGFILWIKKRRICKDFGLTCLTLDTIPVIPGRSLHARIESPLQSSEIAIRLQLLCKQTRPRRFAKTLWQENKNSSLRPDANAAKSTATAEFCLPSDAKPTGFQWSGLIFWQLRAFAINSDSNFYAVFDIPVFNPTDA